MDKIKEFISECEQSFEAVQEYDEKITPSPHVVVNGIVYVPVIEIADLLRKIAEK